MTPRSQRPIAWVLLVALALPSTAWAAPSTLRTTQLANTAHSAPADRLETALGISPAPTGLEERVAALLRTPGNTVPVVTPLIGRDSQLVVDRESVQRYFRYLHDTMHVEAVLLVGKTGECDALGPGLRAQAIQVLTEEARRVEGWTVFTHVTGADAAETLRNAQLATTAGAHALVLAPTAFLATDQAIESFVRELRQAYPTLPILLYNNRTLGRPLSPALVGRLWAERLVVGLKDSSGDLAQFLAYLEAGIPMSQGDEQHLHEAITAGAAHGVVVRAVGSSGNFWPLVNQAAAMSDATACGAAQRVINGTLPIITADGKIPTAAKYLLSKIIVDGVPLMTPIVMTPHTSALTPEQTARLDQLVLPGLIGMEEPERVPAITPLIEELHPQALATLETLVNIPSRTTNRAGVNRVGVFMKAQLETLGFTIETVDRAEVGIGDHLVATRGNDPTRPTVLLMGHMDTVEEGGTFHREDGQLYGPGVMDMKGGLVVLLQALEVLRQRGTLDSVNVVVLLTADEETGSKDSRVLIEAVVRERHPDAVFSFEFNRDGKLITARQGIGNFHRRFEGEGAARRILDMLPQLLALTEEARGNVVSVGRVHLVEARAPPTGRPLLGRFRVTVTGPAGHVGSRNFEGPGDAILEIARKMQALAPMVRDHGHHHLHLITRFLEGGGPLNQIPETATWVIEIYHDQGHLPEADWRWVREEILEILRTPRVNATTSTVEELKEFNPPSPSVGELDGQYRYVHDDQEAALTQALTHVLGVVPDPPHRPAMTTTAATRQLLDAVGLGDLAGQELSGGDISFVAGAVAPRDVPLIDGLGLMGKGAHTSREYAVEASLPYGITTTVRLIEALAASAGAEEAVYELDPLGTVQISPHQFQVEPGRVYVLQYWNGRDSSPSADHSRFVLLYVDQEGQTLILREQDQDFRVLSVTSLGDLGPFKLAQRLAKAQLRTSWNAGARGPNATLSIGALSIPFTLGRDGGQWSVRAPTMPSPFAVYPLRPAARAGAEELHQDRIESQAEWPAHLGQLEHNQLDQLLLTIARLSHQDNVGKMIIGDEWAITVPESAADALRARVGPAMARGYDSPGMVVSDLTDQLRALLWFPPEPESSMRSPLDIAKLTEYVQWARRIPAGMEETREEANAALVAALQAKADELSGGLTIDELTEAAQQAGVTDMELVFRTAERLGIRRLDADGSVSSLLGDDAVSAGMEEWRNLARHDPALFTLLLNELDRQQNTLDLIPSETHTPEWILTPLAHPINDKYSEGYPRKRYYPGTEVADEIEILAQERWLAAVAPVYHGRAATVQDEYDVNVQPHSGSGANQAVYFATLNPGDTVLGLALPHGGHLTHGYQLNLSGKVYRGVSFGVDIATGQIDYDAMKVTALTERPRLLIVGATAYTRQLDWVKLRAIADVVTAANAADGHDAPCLLCADVAHNFAQILVGDYPSPFGLADFVTLTPHKSQGPRSGVVFARKQVYPEVNAHVGISAKAQPTTTLADLVNRAIIPGLQGGPKLTDIAAKAAQALYFQSLEFQQYARQIGPNAKALAAALMRRGAKLVGNGTEVHLMLWDVRLFGLMGASAEQALESVGLIANRNTIPVEEAAEAEKLAAQRQTAFKPAGIRLGVPALTARGMKESEMETVADLLVTTIQHTDSTTGQVESSVKADVQARVRALTEQFPVPSELRQQLHQIQQELQSSATGAEEIQVINEPVLAIDPTLLAELPRETKTIVLYGGLGSLGERFLSAGLKELKTVAPFLNVQIIAVDRWDPEDPNLPQWLATEEGQAFVRARVEKTGTTTYRTRPPNDSESAFWVRDQIRQFIEERKAAIGLPFLTYIPLNKFQALVGDDATVSIDGKPIHVDGVIPAVPTGYHWPLAKFWIEHNIPVWMDKPIAMIHEVPALRALAEPHPGTVMGVDFFMYSDALLWLLSEGRAQTLLREIGDIQRIDGRCVESWGLENENRPWLLIKPVSGSDGLDIDTAVHPLAQMEPILRAMGLSLTQATVSNVFLGCYDPRPPAATAPAGAHTYFWMQGQVGNIPLYVDGGKGIDTIYYGITVTGSRGTLEVFVGTGDHPPYVKVTHADGRAELHVFPGGSLGYKNVWLDFLLLLNRSQRAVGGDLGMRLDATTGAVRVIGRAQQWVTEHGVAVQGYPKGQAPTVATSVLGHVDAQAPRNAATHDLFQQTPSPAGAEETPETIVQGILQGRTLEPGDIAWKERTGGRRDVVVREDRTQRPPVELYAHLQMMPMQNAHFCPLEKTPSAIFAQLGKTERAVEGLVAAHDIIGDTVSAWRPAGMAEVPTVIAKQPFERASDVAQALAMAQRLKEMALIATPVITVRTFTRVTLDDGQTYLLAQL